MGKAGVFEGAEEVSQSAGAVRCSHGFRGPLNGLPPRLGRFQNLSRLDRWRGGSQQRPRLCPQLDPTV